MGILDTVKGWLNIGGVKVKLRQVDMQVPKAGSELKGKVDLTSKGDKHVLKVLYKFMMERSTGKGEDKKTEETVLGETRMNEPFDIKTGETKTLDFAINYRIPDTLKDKSGVLGAVGKLGAFAASEKLEYYVVAECDVKGTALDPSDKVRVTVV